MLHFYIVQLHIAMQIACFMRYFQSVYSRHFFFDCFVSRRNFQGLRPAWAKRTEFVSCQALGDHGLGCKGRESNKLGYKLAFWSALSSVR